MTADSDLEHALAHAADGEAARERVLAALLDATVYVALFPRSGRVVVDASGAATVPAGEQLDLRPYTAGARRFFPLFTAPPRAQVFARGDDHVVAPDSALALLERHPGTDFVINPGSDLSLTLFAAEVATLLRRPADPA